MNEFLELLPPDLALERLLSSLTPSIKSEELDVAQALGRIAAQPVVASYPLPPFPRSTVDGYAVRATDTYGASESLPAYLRLAGEVSMGAAAGFSLEPGSCALIHTGGMLPAEANAVVMVEHTQQSHPNEVEILRPAAEGENLLKVGEDVAEGEQVLQPGVRLRPAEIGGLMALGVTRLQVVCRPQVGLISSGDEIVPPQAAMTPGQVRDVNSYTLSALVEQNGGLPVRYGIVPDRAEALFVMASRAMAESDLVIITAGSSASARDLTSQVIDRLGEPGVLVHGVDVRPGKPTILAVCSGKPVIGLPGNPVSALVIARLFVIPVLEALQGVKPQKAHPSVLARLSLNLASQTGREDWIPVRLQFTQQGILAEPVFGKSNLIFTLARADGLVRIPASATGLSAGEIVEVFPL